MNCIQSPAHLPTQPEPQQERAPNGLAEPGGTSCGAHETKRRRLGGAHGQLAAIGLSLNAEDDEGVLSTLTRRMHVPLRLLPGENPLGVEMLFTNGCKNMGLHGANGKADGQDSRLANGLKSNPAAFAEGLPQYKRYQIAVQYARERMVNRAERKGGRMLAMRALEAAKAFEATCLNENWSSAAERRAACIEYDTVLRQIYPELVLDPHILSIGALDKYEGNEDIQLMRCMQRRFLIWQQQPASDQNPRDAINGHAHLQNTAPNETKLLGDSSPPPEREWSESMLALWRKFCSRMEGKTYAEVDLSSTSSGVSCSLNDTLWMDGRLVRFPVKASKNVLEEVEASKAGRRPGRLYLTDGSMPDYEAHGYPSTAPGMPCGVDAAANEMFPHVVRSSRATNLFHFLKSESTGTGTFTMFYPVGGGANLTAFHYETKRRRSYNCGTGDYIIQPLATTDNARRLVRVHAAVAGFHSRHGQLLPLECYLEEGIKMVTHLRVGPRPTLCELCEQSLHSFISFADAQSTPLPLKLSCNDFDMIWELDATYYLETLAMAYQCSGVLPEEGLARDGADTWIQSSYLHRKPSSRADVVLTMSHTRRPWACEIRAGLRSEAGHKALPAWLLRGSSEAAVDESSLHWCMDVVVVRTAEKLLDVVSGWLCQEHVEQWVGEVPSVSVAKQALRRMGPVLRHMLRRAPSEEDLPATGGPKGGEISLDCHFTKEYLEGLVGRFISAGISLDDNTLEGGMGPIGLGIGLPDRGREMRDGVNAKAQAAGLRRAWMNALVAERETLLTRPVNLDAVAGARERRAQLEKAWDGAVVKILERHAETWKVTGCDVENETVQID